MLGGINIKSSNEISNKTICHILENYVQNEKALVNQLYFKTDHGPTIGGFREDIWRGMFEQIVPKKFVIEQSIFIIDSKGNVSNEVDLAIFDEIYTPYIFRYGRLKFVPIEAVAVAVECKSTSIEKEKLKAWVENIVALETSDKSYTRIATKIACSEENTKKIETTQSSTRPLRILCCLDEGITNGNLASGGRMFDFIIRASSSEQKLQIEVDDSQKSLQDWYLALNHVGKQKDTITKNGSEIAEVKLEAYQVKKGETEPVSLLTFNLQLNQLLMLINNPILFPHLAYAEMFNEEGKRCKKDGTGCKEDGK